MCKNCQKYPKLKKGKDFLKKAKQHKNKGNNVTIRTCGKHQIVKYKRKGKPISNIDQITFSIPIPDHPKDLSKGIRHKLIRYFLAAGIPLGILVFYFL